MDEIISIDTNVLVRFLTKDDAAQFEIAKSLIDSNRIFVPDTVILETEWVLRFAYHFDPPSVTNAFCRFLGLENVNVQDSSRLNLAIRWHEQGLDFADAMHLASSQHTPALATFDKDFCKRAPQPSSCRLMKL